MTILSLLQEILGPYQQQREATLVLSDTIEQIGNKLFLKERTA